MVVQENIWIVFRELLSILKKILQSATLKTTQPLSLFTPSTKVCGCVQF